MSRPHYCPDPERCQLVWSNYTKEEFEKGVSFNCFGRLPEPHLFVERETEHKNDLSRCIYTPLKGCIRFLECFDDLWLDFLVNGRVMDKLQPLICKRCGKLADRQHGGTTNGMCPMCYSIQKMTKALKPFVSRNTIIGGSFEISLPLVCGNPDFEVALGALLKKER